MLVGRDEYAWAWIQMQRRFIVTVICFCILTKRNPKIPHYCTCRTLHNGDSVLSANGRTYCREELVFSGAAFLLSYLLIAHLALLLIPPTCMGDDMTRAFFNTPALNFNNIVVHFATRFTDSFSRQFRGRAKLNMVRSFQKRLGLL